MTNTPSKFTLPLKVSTHGDITKSLLARAVKTQKGIDILSETPLVTAEEVDKIWSQMRVSGKTGRYNHFLTREGGERARMVSVQLYTNRDDGHASGVVRIHQAGPLEGDML